MGFAIHLTAMQAGEAKAGLSRLGLARGVEEDEYTEAPRSGAEHRGRFILWTNTRRAQPPAEDALADLAGKIGPVLSLEVDETSMASRACGFADGRLAWAVDGWVDRSESDGPPYREHGAPPLGRPALEALVRDFERSLGLEPSDEVDPFSLPVELFVAETGFRYDQANEAMAFKAVHALNAVNAARAVQPPAPGPRPWWKIW